MVRVQVTTAKSTIEEIVPRYNLAVQATHKITDRSILDDQYNKRAIFYSSPDQIVEIDNYVETTLLNKDSKNTGDYHVTFLSPYPHDSHFCDGTARLWPL